MKIEYFHASKYGNGAMVAEELKRIMSATNNVVNVHHVRDADPKRVPTADLFVFSSPGRMGKPIGAARRFPKNVWQQKVQDFAAVVSLAHLSR